MKSVHYNFLKLMHFVIFQVFSQKPKQTSPMHPSSNPLEIRILYSIHKIPYSEFHKFFLGALVGKTSVIIRNLNGVAPILAKSGEVIRQLSPHRTEFQRDLRWLETRGNQRLARLFDKGIVGLSPDQRPASVLKRASYILGCQLADAGRSQKLRVYLQDPSPMEDSAPKVSPLAPSANENPFFWCLHLLSGGEDWLTRDQRSKTTKQLLYAYRHRVPPQYLIGFILQIGSNEAASRSNGSINEEWYNRGLHKKWNNFTKW